MTTFSTTHKYTREHNVCAHKHKGIEEIYDFFLHAKRWKSIVLKLSEFWRVQWTKTDSHRNDRVTKSKANRKQHPS